MASSSEPSFNGDIDHGQLETLQTEKTLLSIPQAQAAKDAIRSIIRRLDSKAQGQTHSTQNWRHCAHHEGRSRGPDSSPRNQRWWNLRQWHAREDPDSSNANQHRDSGR